MNDGTTRSTGTSFATPFVTGASVLAQEHYLRYTDNLCGNFDTFQDRLLDLFQRTGKSIVDSETGLVYMRLDISAAINEIDREFAPIPEPATGFMLLLGLFLLSKRRHFPK